MPARAPPPPTRPSSGRICLPLPSSPTRAPPHGHGACEIVTATVFVGGERTMRRESGRRC
uniref:Uncharacterized protein n=1 Tax=Oryza punctata TaxID=4537 RepID=A0A0E0LUP0_ORYPU